MPSNTKPNIIAGHAHGADELKRIEGSTGLLEFLTVATSPTSTHADLMSDQNLMQAVFQRIKACGINASS
jgi:hypothetical protein